MRLLALKTVLVATENDETSLLGIRAAADLAAAAGASLHVVHVAAADTSGALDVLDRSMRGIDAKMHVLSGEPVDAIRALADRLGADVIVLGPHRGGPPGSGERRLGSTALAVVTNATAPCLVIAGSLPLPLHHVLVPVDMSDTARGALLVGLTWASGLRQGNEKSVTRLTGLHVGKSIAAESSGADRVRWLEEELARLRLTGGSWAGVDVESAAVQGDDTAATIAEYSVQRKADLIVIGTRGLGLDAVGRLGSVAGDMIRLLPVPVLLVPPAVWSTHASSA
jgi:nucleotide-binding universal stress UspA family protein